MQNYLVGKEFNTYYQQLLLISYVLIKELNATYNYIIQNNKGPVSIRPVSRPLLISFKLCVIKVVCLSCKILKCWINR